MANILFIDHTLNPSGAAISLGTLIRHLSVDWRPHFILRQGSRNTGLLGAERVPSHIERWMPDFPTVQGPQRYSPLLWSWHFSKIPVAFWELRELCRRWRIDLIHANETTLVAYALMAGWLRLPVVLHARCPLIEERLPRALLEQAARHPAFHAIAIDHETLISFPPLMRAKASVVYNPIELMPAAADRVRALRQHWGLAEGDVAVGQVANLHATKGVWEILDLARKICSTHQHIKFVFVGDDRENAGEGLQLKAAARAAGLDSKVIFAGFTRDVADVYGALDVALCVFANSLKAVGRTVYEAALSGCPMILALEGGESSPTLLDGALGTVTSPGDLEAMATQIVRLSSDRVLRRALGERARQAIGSRHTPAHAAHQVEEVYRHLLGAPSQHPLTSSWTKTKMSVP
jgi:glycosyltransferase involved in cell wall biosynthesis